MVQEGKGGQGGSGDSQRINKVIAKFKGFLKICDNQKNVLSPKGARVASKQGQLGGQFS